MSEIKELYGKEIEEMTVSEIIQYDLIDYWVRVAEEEAMVQEMN